MYSNRIFTQLNAGIPEEAKISANAATQYLGVFSTLSAMSAFYLAARLSRKTLFLTGQVTMCALLLAMAAFGTMKNGLAVLILVCLFIISFYLTTHSVHWIYLPEILSDQQWGFVSTVHYINGIELSLVTEYMLEYFKPEGTFLFYGIVSFLGIFWFIYVIKETKGLTDKQKKALYFPKKSPSSSGQQS